MKSTYTFTLVNPVPKVSSTSPAHVLTGGTQPVILTGSGLLPGTVVAFNGKALPTTYISYNQVKLDLTVADNATGTLSLQVQNPTPGGGPGTTFTESVEPNSIALTATGVDGVNTGYADMDSKVAMTATVTGSLQTAVNWSLTDSVGSISSNGVYTPPATLNPNAHHARIIATLASNPAISAYYWVDIINGVPSITDASPDIVPAGKTTAVTITGTGFVPGTVVEVNGAAVPTTYVSPTSIVGKISRRRQCDGQFVGTGRHRQLPWRSQRFLSRSDLGADQRDGGGAAARPDYLWADDRPDPARAAGRRDRVAGGAVQYSANHVAATPGGCSIVLRKYCRRSGQRTP